MPREYKLKRPVIDLERLKKIAKKTMEDGAKDRELAIETLAFFRGLVDQNPDDDAAKKCMTDCMKLAQTAKVNVTKMIELIIKIEDLDDKRKNISIGSKNPTINFFSELENAKEI